MLPFLNLFGVAIAFPPLVLIVGIWLGASLSEKHAARYKLSGELIFNLIFSVLVAYIVGGRLSYALQHPSAFSGNLLNLLSRNAGLFDPIGGLLIAAVTAFIFGQRKQLKLWPTLDAVTPALAVLMLAVPLANLASGSAYGAPSNMPWAIQLWGASRHPVQIYEAVGAALILWAVWPGRVRSTAFPGAVFLQFSAYSALARLFFEGFRGSSLAITALDLRAAQLAAWIVLAAVLWLYQSRRSVQEESYGSDG